MALTDLPVIGTNDLGRIGLDGSGFAVGSGEGKLRRVYTDAEIAETAPFIPKTNAAVITALTNGTRASFEV